MNMNSIKKSSKIINKSAPILILGFNSAENIARILDICFINKVEKIYVSIDGPRKNNLEDKKENDKIKVILENYQSKKALNFRLLDKNLGIRKAIPDAISWVFTYHERIIIIEDDVIPTKNFFFFINLMLENYKDSIEIGSISGYTNYIINHYPRNDAISCRLSIYPESYAWGTWKNRWDLYCDSSVDRITLKQIYSQTKSTLIALSWKINFTLVRLNIIDSWAYRWVASLWTNKRLTIVPNENLVTYIGTEGRTHTLQNQKWRELATRQKPFKEAYFINEDIGKIDKTIGKKFHNGSLIGICTLLLVPFYRLFFRLLRSKNLFNNL